MPSNYYPQEPRRTMTRRETFRGSMNPDRAEQDALLLAHGYGGLDQARVQENVREQDLRKETIPFRAKRGMR